MTIAWTPDFRFSADSDISLFIVLSKSNQSHQFPLLLFTATEREGEGFHLVMRFKLPVSFYGM